MPTADRTHALQRLAAQVQGLTAADRLRLAALLLDEGLYDLARAIVEQVDGELALVKLTEGR